MTGTIGADKLYRISVEYPDLNVEWLMTGEGEMLNEAKLVPMESDVAHLLRIVEDHDVRFHELAHRILDGMGVPRVKKESAVS